MRAFTIVAPDAGEVREVAAPEPGPGEVIVAPAFVGICGTDYHIFRGSFLSRYPLINGHEFSGTVAATGEGVHGWREGDRVTVDPTLTCGVCHRCRRGQSNHCEAWGAIGDTTDGALAEGVRVPARNLYRVEAHETLDDAAFTEPLACVVWGIQRLRIQPGDSAIVFGAGPIGSLMTQMLALNGVGDLVVVDVAPEKLDVAARMGARATEVSGPDLDARLEDRTDGRGFDLVIDCTGSPDVIQGLFRHAGPAARILFFGVAPPGAEVRIKPFDVYHRDWEIVGSMAINGTFGRARDLIASGRVEVRPLLTRVAGLDDVATILTTPKAPAELKVMVAPNPP
jgi:threonine dehydrogenase-like Zn-dependent dehydrogenase